MHAMHISIMACTLQVKFDRQKRLKRIREMENSLCKEMGETTQPCCKSQVPSEEELKSFLQRVETLEHALVSNGECVCAHLMQKHFPE